MENQEKIIIPIPPEIWEKLRPLHAKLEENKPRMRELMEQMDQMKSEMKMITASIGFHKRALFHAIKSQVPEMPEHGCYEIELDPPRIIYTETKSDPDLKKVLEAAKALGMDIGDLL